MSAAPWLLAREAANPTLALALTLARPLTVLLQHPVMPKCEQHVQMLATN